MYKRERVSCHLEWQSELAPTLVPGASTALIPHIFPCMRLV
jgi:hypothetical protein